MAKGDGAVSQLRLQRVLQLQRLFRTGRSYDLSTLADVCRELDPGVTERTTASDIAFLRDVLHAPLADRANRWHGFRYQDSYSIFEGLDDSFAGTLDEVVSVVRQLARKPEFAGLEDLLLRLEQRVAQLNASQADVLQFDEPDLKGRQHLLPLYRAILSESTLQLSYEPFGQNATTFSVRPVLLRQFNNRWFLLAWRNGIDRIQTYPIDRIVALATTTLPIMPINHPTFNAQEYFENRIGVTKGDGPVLVILRFSRERGHYVSTKKLHPSQRTEEQADGHFIVRLLVEVNRELEARLLEFGPDVEVLEPEELREQIRTRLTRALAQYG